MKLLLIVMLVGSAIAGPGPRARRQIGATSAAGSQNILNNLFGSSLLLTAQQVLNIAINQIIANLQINAPINLAVANSGPSSAIVNPTSVSGGSQSGLGGVFGILNGGGGSSGGGLLGGGSGGGLLGGGSGGGGGGILANLGGLLGGFGSAPHRSQLSCHLVDSRLSTLTNEPGITIPLPTSFDMANNLANMGYSTDGNTHVHSLLTGKMADDVMKMASDKKDENSHELTEQELLDETLEEYSLQSLSSLVKSGLKSFSKIEKVTKSLDCQMINFECTLANRNSADKVHECSKTLCTCLSELRSE